MEGKGRDGEGDTGHAAHAVSELSQQWCLHSLSLQRQSAGNGPPASELGREEEGKGAMVEKNKKELSTLTSQEVKLASAGRVWRVCSDSLFSALLSLSLSLSLSPFLPPSLTDMWATRCHGSRPVQRHLFPGVCFRRDLVGMWRWHLAQWTGCGLTAAQAPPLQDHRWKALSNQRNWRGWPLRHSRHHLSSFAPSQFSHNHNHVNYCIPLCRYIYNHIIHPWWHARVLDSYIIIMQSLVTDWGFFYHYYYDYWYPHTAVCNYNLF